MTDKDIIEVLTEMKSNLCMGCSGCKTKCLDYEVLDHLIKEKSNSAKCTVAINKDFYKEDKSNPINRSDLFQ